MHLGPPVLDKVERSWSCWRHPNASGVGVNVACAMGNTRFSQAPGDFLEGGCARVRVGLVYPVPTTTTKQVLGSMVTTTTTT